MVNKRLLHVLFLAISISNCFAIKDPTQITKEEQTYYEKEEWDYLETILIKKAHEVNSRTKTIINYISKGTLVLPTILYAYVCRENIHDLPWLLLSIFGEIAPAFIGIINSYIVKTIGKKFFKKRIKREKFVNLIELFLQKYNPEIDNESDEINYKKIIPQELHQIFDELHEKYCLYGKKYLKENNLYFIEAIKSKIIHKIKKEKYAYDGPETIVQIR